MTAVHTWDVLTTLDGHGFQVERAGRVGCWSEQGPELLAHWAGLVATPQRMVSCATTRR